MRRVLTLSLLDTPLELDPQVALRPEPFGALAYHYRTRKLVFLKHRDVVRVAQALATQPSLSEALRACAGPLLPLIDQAAAGFSGGTWTVTVSDSAPHDVEEFKAAFPALARTPIEDDALPPWDKAKETMRWQAN